MTRWHSYPVFFRINIFIKIFSYKMNIFFYKKEYWNQRLIYLVKVIGFECNYIRMKYILFRIGKHYQTVLHIMNKKNRNYSKDSLECAEYSPAFGHESFVSGSRLIEFHFTIMKIVVGVLETPTLRLLTVGRTLPPSISTSVHLITNTQKLKIMTSISWR